ncbi:MAG: DNA mismatch repair protein MutS [Candidatus Pelethousia sp.]|nr:DNA mismatch repair protein MutS [Candidatus Pelethousia sp.]
MNSFLALEFDTILANLANHALSAAAKARCMGLRPSLQEAQARRWMEETTQAKRIVEGVGTPPVSSMTELQKAMELLVLEAMLLPEHFAQIASFLASCRRIKAYLRKAETMDSGIACYGRSIDELGELAGEIDRCIRNGVVDDKASAQLDGLRRRMAGMADQVKEKLDTLLRKNKAWFSESFISIRNGRYTLPVKREYKNAVAGAVIELSNSGGTCFIEPASIGKIQSQIAALKVEEETEVRRILYALTSLVSHNIPAIKLNMETMETLDFLFAKAKLSISMQASPVKINVDREMQLHHARHPLLHGSTAVPLNFMAGNGTRGVIITGPNTGGKTVALKTVGLLSLMAQSGLHVPADEESSFCMHNLILCDIGDGQSIAENLSTFSSHMKNILEILGRANGESLVLLDELGSGTDPAEGMGLAVAVLDALCEKECLFVVTTHYPEIKTYAAKKPGLVNARMAFDKENLQPLYRLEIGEAGESCALYIAQRLGMPPDMLKRAREAAYGRAGEAQAPALCRDAGMQKKKLEPTARITKQEARRPSQTPCEKLNRGDSVFVYPQKEIGIVYACMDEKGEVGVQIKGEKKRINHKRLKLHVAADELYPEDYDFSIVFDSVANRKARNIQRKRHEEGTVVVLREGEKEP